MGGPRGRPDFFQWRDLKANTAKQATASTTNDSSTDRGKTTTETPSQASTADVSKPGGTAPSEDPTASLTPVTSSSIAVATAKTRQEVSANGPTPATVVNSPASVSSAGPESKATEEVDQPVPTKKHDVTRYDEMLTERQKVILRERAQALSIDPKDYEHLLSEDEKDRLDSLVDQNPRRVTTGE